MKKLDSLWRCYRVANLTRLWNTSTDKVKEEIKDSPYIRIERAKLYPWWAVSGQERPLLSLGQVLCEPGVLPQDCTLEQFVAESVDVRTVAEYMRLSTTAITRYMHGGQLPSIDVMGLRMHPDWLIRWMCENVTKGED